MLYLGAQANVVAVRWIAPPELTVAIYENATQPLYTNSLAF